MAAEHNQPQRARRPGAATLRPLDDVECVRVRSPEERVEIAHRVEIYADQVQRGGRITFLPQPTDEEE